jgi:hypothetical protein
MTSFSLDGSAADQSSISGSDTSDSERDVTTVGMDSDSGEEEGGQTAHHRHGRLIIENVGFFKYPIQNKNDRSIAPN